MTRRTRYYTDEILLALFFGLIVGTLLAVVLIRFFVTPTISDKKVRQERLNVQRRCEDEFATFPREHGKTLQQGIEKCRKVAGINAIGGAKR